MWEHLFNTKENDVSYYKTQICLIKVLYAKSRWLIRQLLKSQMTQWFLWKMSESNCTSTKFK